MERLHRLLVTLLRVCQCHLLQESTGVDSMGVDSMGVDSMGVDNMGAGSIGVNSMGAHNMGARNMGVDSMGVNSMGAGSMGAHNMGADNMGVNSMGADSMGADNMGVGGVDSMGGNPRQLLRLDMLLATPVLPALHQAASMEGLLLMVHHTSTKVLLTVHHTSTEIPLLLLSSQEHLKDMVTAVMGGRGLSTHFENGGCTRHSRQSLPYQICKARA